MSTRAPSLFEWDGHKLVSVDPETVAGAPVLAADSWLVSDGTALALDLHRDRFAQAVTEQLSAVPELVTSMNLSGFWDASLSTISRQNNQFPRVELRERNGVPQLFVWQREAPDLTVSLTVATHVGLDPRTQPRIKGPDTVALLQAREDARARGADEAVLLSPTGFVAEGAYTGLVWWRGDILCVPSPELDRVDSVTARSVVALATALGLDVSFESVTPEDLSGREVWALSALHGIRIVTEWIDGPALAAEPGRLGLWRARLHKLRKPLPPLSAPTTSD